MIRTALQAGTAMALSKKRTLELPTPKAETAGIPLPLLKLSHPMSLPPRIWLTFSMFCLAAGPALAEEIGPERGALLIVGGGPMEQSIREAFLKLAGGAEARIVVIPTAAGAESYDENYYEVQMWKELAPAEVSLLHTTDRLVADTDEFNAPLKRATAVWLGGGRQWRLADAYLGTRTMDALRGVLDRDGVIGGSSAGATIQGSFLARGDTRGNHIMMGDHQEGFGFLKDVAIDQHLLTRNRQFDLLEIVEAHPHILGIGIDENTAILVRRQQFEVLGGSYVAVYDSQAAGESKNAEKYRPFQLLKRGERFDLQNRKVLPATR